MVYGNISSLCNRHDLQQHCLHAYAQCILNCTMTRSYNSQRYPQPLLCDNAWKQA